MKVFLVVIALWGMAYKGQQATPVLVQEMPSMGACKAVAKVIVEQTSDKDAWGPSRAICVDVSNDR